MSGLYVSPFSPVNVFAKKSAGISYIDTQPRFSSTEKLQKRTNPYTQKSGPSFGYIILAALAALVTGLGGAGGMWLLQQQNQQQPKPAEVVMLPTPTLLPTPTEIPLPSLEDIPEPAPTSTPMPTLPPIPTQAPMLLVPPPTVTPIKETPPAQVTAAATPTVTVAISPTSVMTAELTDLPSTHPSAAAIAEYRAMYQSTFEKSEFQNVLICSNETLKPQGWFNVNKDDRSQSFSILDYIEPDQQNITRVRMDDSGMITKATRFPADPDEIRRAEEECLAILDPNYVYSDSYVHSFDERNDEQPVPVSQIDAVYQMVVALFQSGLEPPPTVTPSAQPTQEY